MDKIKKWWKNLKYWQKSGLIGLIIGVILGIFSFISILIEWNIGAYLLFVGASSFQKLYPCNDAPCAAIIIPFSIIALAVLVAIISILISVIIIKFETKK